MEFLFLNRTEKEEYKGIIIIDLVNKLLQRICVANKCKHYCELAIIE